MTGIGVKLLIIWIGLLGNNNVSSQQGIDNDYRAAKYSIQIDVTVPDDIPELANVLPHSFMAYVYYIQYGKNTIIELRDSGEKIATLGFTIIKWDYSKRQSSFTLVMDRVRKYHTSIDSIQFELEDCRGISKNMCADVTLNTRCDSISFVADSTNTQYYVHFIDTTSNLASHKLLYPDIKYLPNKLIKIARNKSHVMNLEEVVYGKAAIDALLNLYKYEGYEQIPDEEWNNPDPEVKEFVEKLFRSRK